MFHLCQMEHCILRYVQVELWRAPRWCFVTLSISVDVDDIIEHIVKKSIGCVFRSTVVIIILYADENLLLAPSVDSLQRLVSMCEHEPGSLDLAINVRKSVCTIALARVAMFHVALFP